MPITKWRTPRPPNRIVTGAISSVGGVVLGKMFTSVKLSTGRYKITFENASEIFLKGEPIVIATPRGGESVCIQIETLEPEFCIINIKKRSDGLAFDCPFCFVAYAPISFY